METNRMVLQWPRQVENRWGGWMLMLILSCVLLYMRGNGGPVSVKSEVKRRG